MREPQPMTRRHFARLLGCGTLGTALAAWGGTNTSSCSSSTAAAAEDPPVTASGAEAAESPTRVPDFAFGVLADPQFCDEDPAGSRFYRQSAGKLAECVAAFNAKKLAFVIQLGDLIDRDFASFDAMLPIYERLHAPRYHVLGNHDFAVSERDKPRVPAKLGMSQRWYRFQHPGWRFIVLDGNDLSLIARGKTDPQYQLAKAMLEELKSRKAAHAQTWNGGLGRTQLVWLEAELAEAQRAGERAIVFCHFPVFPVNAHNLWNDSEVIRILESHSCTAAYFNGHNHAGHYAEKKGIHYVTLPGMVETQDQTAWAVVRVWPERLELSGHSRMPSRTLPLRD